MLIFDPPPRALVLVPGSPIFYNYLFISDAKDTDPFLTVLHLPLFKKTRLALYFKIPNHKNVYTKSC